VWIELSEGMGTRVVIGRVESFSDARGLVVEPLMPDLLSGQRNVHIVLTQPGCVRGNHYQL
jgi:UDP-2-acetamido-2,6-beta-L-arabino-hexul-4-ose reductase